MYWVIHLTVLGETMQGKKLYTSLEEAQKAASVLESMPGFVATVFDSTGNPA